MSHLKTECPECSKTEVGGCICVKAAFDDGVSAAQRVAGFVYKYVAIFTTEQCMISLRANGYTLKLYLW